MQGEWRWGYINGAKLVFKHLNFSVAIFLIVPSKISFLGNKWEEILHLERKETRKFPRIEEFRVAFNSWKILERTTKKKNT